MGDELLEALGKRQRELDEAEAPTDAVEGDAGEALLDGLFEQLDSHPKAQPSEPENVTSLPVARSRTWAIAGVALAAAAALVLWFAMRPPAPPELPPYTAVSIVGGPAEVRGDHDTVADTVKLRTADDAIDWRFSAKAPVDHALSVSLLARSEDGDTTFATVADADISDSGSVRLRGPLSAFIELSPGTWSVGVIIAPTGHAPRSATEAASGPWQRLPVEVVIDAPRP